uniref:Uncharacterized protein n=1 Tax=Oryza meridionalis TaxID=40149 RepID=A0A0E0D1V3_9ORYZ
MAMTSCPAGASAMLNLDLYSCRARHCLKCTVRTELTGGYSICSLLGTERTEERGNRRCKNRSKTKHLVSITGPV